MANEQTRRKWVDAKTSKKQKLKIQQIVAGQLTLEMSMLPEINNFIIYEYLEWWIRVL